jgi:hypothetical protein
MGHPRLIAELLRPTQERQPKTATQIHLVAELVIR